MNSTVVQDQTILHVSAALLSRTNGAARTDAHPRRYLFQCSAVARSSVHVPRYRTHLMFMKPGPPPQVRGPEEPHPRNRPNAPLGTNPACSFGCLAWPSGSTLTPSTKTELHAGRFRTRPPPILPTCRLTRLGTRSDAIEHYR